MKSFLLRKLIREEIRRIINEEDVIPIGPDGTKISDAKTIKNLNFAIKAVDSTIRPKLKALIEDPGAAKSLKSPAQRVAIIGAIAIAFGISEKEFSQIITKIKDVLKSSE